MTKNATSLQTLRWCGGLDGYVEMIDQTLLPEKFELLECRDVETVWHAIKRLSVRGAPAIGVAAAMGLVLAIRDTQGDRAAVMERLAQASEYLASSRPTAVNLFWAIERMNRVANESADLDAEGLKNRLLEEAKTIRDEDAAMCRAIGEVGAPLIADGAGILTHCNAGGLATAEFGTALAPIYVAHANGRKLRVFADETRPLLQGSRLTAWELDRAGIDVTVLCDNMAASAMQQGLIDLVITGADRIAANGDVANKIGTYGIAVLANAHNIPFYVAAPSSTFDENTKSGADIPIEMRGDEEVRHGFGRQTAPDNVKCHCPAFDVTPAHLVTALITERGMIQPVSTETVAEVFK
ncbi:MAG: S-methyl-5-thioribose-1-phosphate isomerase [Phycisphaerales bacterium]|nr:S-methyl-5-thioribose-1-phosphate isomerase [Phycisphaerales bacterium]